MHFSSTMFAVHWLLIDKRKLYLWLLIETYFISSRQVIKSLAPFLSNDTQLSHFYILQYAPIHLFIHFVILWIFLEIYIQCFRKYTKFVLKCYSVYFYKPYYKCDDLMVGKPEKYPCLFILRHIWESQYLHNWTIFLVWIICHSYHKTPMSICNVLLLTSCLIW